MGGGVVDRSGDATVNDEALPPLQPVSPPLVSGPQHSTPTYQSPIRSQATSPVDVFPKVPLGRGFASAQQGGGGSAFAGAAGANPVVELSQVDKEIDKQRKALMQTCDAHATTRYHIGELDVLIARASAAVQASEAELAQALSDLKLIESGENPDSLVEARLQRRRDLYEKMLEKQVAEADATAVLQFDAENALHAEIEVLDQELALLHKKLKEADPTPAPAADTATPADGGTPTADASADPKAVSGRAGPVPPPPAAALQDDAETVIATAADLQHFLTLPRVCGSAPAPEGGGGEGGGGGGVWRALGGLKRLPDALGGFCWQGPAVQSLLHDCRLAATRHANFQPWDVTVPIYAFTSEMHEDLVWAVTGDELPEPDSANAAAAGGAGGLPTRGARWKVVRDSRAMEAAYRASGGDSVEMANGDSLEHADSLEGVDYFVSRAALKGSPRNMRRRTVAARCAVAQRGAGQQGSSANPHAATGLADPVAWLPVITAERLCAARGGGLPPLPPSSTLEYLHSRPPDESIDLRGSALGASAWSVRPIANPGIPAFIAEAAEARRPFPKEDVFAALEDESLPVADITFLGSNSLSLPRSGGGGGGGGLCIEVSSVLPAGGAGGGACCRGGGGGCGSPCQREVPVARVRLNQTCALPLRTPAGEGPLLCGAQPQGGEPPELGASGGPTSPPNARTPKAPGGGTQPGTGRPPRRQMGSATSPRSGSPTSPTGPRQQQHEAPPPLPPFVNITRGVAPAGAASPDAACREAFSQLQADHLQLALCFVPEGWCGCGASALDTARSSLEAAAQLWATEQTARLPQAERRHAALLRPAPRVHCVPSGALCATGAAAPGDAPADAVVSPCDRLTLLGISCKGARSGTAVAALDPPEAGGDAAGAALATAVEALLQSACRAAGWEPSGPPPSLVFVTLPCWASLAEASGAVRAFFGAPPPQLRNTFLFAHSAEGVHSAQATALWMGGAALLSSTLLSPFAPLTGAVPPEGAVTMIDDTSIVTIDSSPAAAVYARWCTGGAVEGHLARAKSTGETQFFHAAPHGTLAFLEVAVQGDAAPAGGEAAGGGGGAGSPRRAVILPIGVTPGGALRTVERPARGSVRPFAFSPEEMQAQVQEYIRGCPIPPREVGAVLLCLPAGAGAAPPGAELSRGIARGIWGPGGADAGGGGGGRSVVVCHTAGRVGALPRGAAAATSALPQVILLGFRRAGSASGLQLGHLPSLFRVRLLGAGGTDSEGTLHITRSVVAAGLKEGGSRGGHAITLRPPPGRAVQPHELRTRELAYSITIRRQPPPPGAHPPGEGGGGGGGADEAGGATLLQHLMRAAVHVKGVVGSDGCVKPRHIRESLSFQVLQHDPTGRVFLLGLSGATPVVVDVTRAEAAWGRDSFLEQGTLAEGVARARHVCATCGIPALHSMPEGYCAVWEGEGEGGEQQQQQGTPPPPLLLCVACYFAQFVVRLQRVAVPSPYQIDTLVAGVLAAAQQKLPSVPDVIPPAASPFSGGGRGARGVAAAGQAVPPPYVETRTAEGVAVIPFGELTHEAPHGFAHRGVLLPREGTRVHLGLAPREALLPFIFVLDQALRCARVGGCAVTGSAPSHGTHVSYRALRVASPSCGGAGVCEEGALFGWSRFSDSSGDRPPPVAGEAHRVFTVSTSLAAGATFQWARLARCAPVLLPLGTLLRVVRCAEDTTSVVEVGLDQAEALLRRAEALGSGASMPSELEEAFAK